MSGKASNITWTCHICGRIRPDRMISVYTSDISDRFHLPLGTVSQNVRFCADQLSCTKAAATFTFFQDGCDSL